VNPRRDRFAFGPFVLDEERGLLLRDGEPLALTPRAHATLLVLLRSAGSLLGRQELLDAVWPGLHVEENNLSQQIAVLRRTLGEGWIETAPRRGYRFAGTVRNLAVEEAAAALPTEDRRAGGQSSLARAWPVVAAAAAMIAGLLLATLPHQPGSSQVGSPVRSLAVLPFATNIPGELAEPVGFGLAEAVGERLGSAGAIAVRPLAAVRGLGGERDPLAAARRLRVDGIVLATFRWQAQQVGADVRLVDGRDGRVRWSGTVTLAASELSRLPEAIAGSLSRQLGEGTTGVSLPPQLPRRRVEPAAYTDYLKGRWHWGRRTLSELQAAEADFRAAIARDPGYAAAHAGLADALLSQGRHEEARTVATHALALDGTLAEPYATLGFLAGFQDRDRRAAATALRRAIEINPSYATAYQWLAFVELSQGRCAQAKGAIGRAQELDPLSLIIATDDAHVDYYCGDLAAAERKVRAALELDGNFAQAHGVLGGVLVEQGRFTEALREYGEMERLSGPPTHAITLLVHARQRDLAAVERDFAWLRRHGVTPHPYALACTMAWLERPEEAWTSLGHAVAQRDSNAMLLAVDPAAAALRRDPRVLGLMQQLGLPRGRNVTALETAGEPDGGTAPEPGPS
jgi:DNA-binding winged helix-turn-helix (wHTH) protein/tetratricopeptide (TPR) repeat protein